MIGRGNRVPELRRRAALGRVLKRLILSHGSRQLVIALMEAPELQGNHVSLHLALRIPVGTEPTRLTRADKHRLESFLDGAIRKTSLKPGSQGRRRAASGL